MTGQFYSAIKSLWNSKWSTLIAISSIGVCFFIITILFIGLYNLDVFTKNLSNKAAFVVYIKNGISKNETLKLIEELKSMETFSKVKFISKEEALNEMKNTIEPSLIELIGFNPLSDSIELFLKDEKLTSAEELINKIKNSEIVEDVYYPSKVINILKTIKMTLWNLGIVLFSLLSISILFIIYATVKNHYWRKHEEIEILKLLGATPAYIRYPFLAEGGLLGFLGGSVATCFILLIYFLLQTKNIGEFLPVLSQIVFPIETIYSLPAGGFILGVLSAFFALGKIRYQ